MGDGHRSESCQGRWIDVGTLRDPYRQICNSCRAARQKPIDDGDVLDVSALGAAERRHARGLSRFKDELEHDPVHQDEEGFWFWDEAWSERHGPYETEEIARGALDEYAESLVIEPDDNPVARWFLGVVLLACAFAAGWMARGL